MNEGINIPIFWLLFAVLSIVVCHMSAAETVGFNRKVIRKHPECGPRNVFEFISGRNYLRWKKADRSTRAWHRVCVSHIVLALCELLFLLAQLVFFRGSVYDFFTWIGGDKAGILVIGSLPFVLYVLVYAASKSGVPAEIRRALLEGVCPVFSVILSVGVLTLILLLAVWTKTQ